jgi:transcriptional regulator with XRE-family HTH domain
MNLSRRIRDLRYAKGWGPDELASRAKISRTALYQIERGNTSKPQAGTLRRISRALGVPLESLLDAGAASIEVDVAAPIAANPATPSSLGAGRPASSDRAEELMEKFRMLLASPLAEGVARIIEESFRLLPIIPPPTPSEPTRYSTPVEFDSTRQRRGRTTSSV